MGKQARTTESLRETLFDTLDQLSTGETTPQQAAQVANLAQVIIKTAELEIKYVLTLDKLDRGEQGLSPGPLLLAQRRDVEE